MWERLSRWHRSTLGHGLAGAIVLWAALPPLDLWPLAWIAPVWWLRLVRRQKLTGRRPYLMLWLAGFVLWLGVYHWLRLPHWATSFGWVAVAIYHAFYLPVFVGISRVAVHRLRVPLVLAAPIVATGLELARAYLLTGITMGSLPHTQYHWLALIQISDLAGAYGVGFVMMLVSACLAQTLPLNETPEAGNAAGPRSGPGRKAAGSSWSFWPLGLAAAVMAAVLVYGYARMGAPHGSPQARIALIQGSIDTTFESHTDTEDDVFRQYMALTRDAVQNHGPVDLVVWPETMFRYPLVEGGPNAAKPAEYAISDDEFHAKLPQWVAKGRELIADTEKMVGVPMVLGIDVWDYRDDGLRRYNSAIYVPADFVADSARQLPRYDKMHLVLFGEYVPLAKQFAWLQGLTPLPYSIDAGTTPATFAHRGLRFSPNICYESVLPQVIRRQVLYSTAHGEPPDVLLNMTNDGWFWGSSELNLHLICAVFRAVECRKPYLIAANTGLSAVVDGDGRILQQGQPRQEGVLVAEVQPDGRTSWYLAHGDWLAGTCLGLTILFGGAGLWLTLRR